MIGISLVFVAALLGVVGCGDDGAAKGSAVRIYLGVDLCADAQWVLAGPEGEASNLEVEAVCLRPTESGGHLDLATIGANARRATEDSSAIAYVEKKSPANRFAEPIVEEAGIAFVIASWGGQTTKQILHAVEEAGSGSLRDEVRDALETG